MASKEKRGRKAPRVTPASPDWEESGAYRALRANRGRKARPVTLAQLANEGRRVNQDPPENAASKARKACQDQPAPPDLMDNPALRVMPELLVIRALLARKD
jgi:hypothetical protein